MRRGAAVAIAAALVFVDPAQAHDPVGGNTFWSGLLHPWLVPAHVLALTGLILLAGGQGTRWLFAGFAAGLLAGAFALTRGLGETPAPLIILALAAVSGTLAATALTLPGLASAGIAFTAGIAMALDSPPQAVRIEVALLIQLGSAVGALIPLVLFGTLAARFRGTPAWIGARVLGAWVAASAILVLALRLAR